MMEEKNLSKRAESRNINKRESSICKDTVHQNDKSSLSLFLSPRNIKASTIYDCVGGISNKFMYFSSENKNARHLLRHLFHTIDARHKWNYRKRENEWLRAHYERICEIAHRVFAFRINEISIIGFCCLWEIPSHPKANREIIKISFRTNIQFHFLDEAKGKVNESHCGFKALFLRGWTRSVMKSHLFTGRRGMCSIWEGRKYFLTFTQSKATKAPWITFPSTLALHERDAWNSLNCVSRFLSRCD